MVRLVDQSGAPCALHLAVRDATGEPVIKYHTNPPGRVSAPKPSREGFRPKSLPGPFIPQKFRLRRAGGRACGAQTANRFEHKSSAVGVSGSSRLRVKTRSRRLP